MTRSPSIASYIEQTDPIIPPVAMVAPSTTCIYCRTVLTPTTKWAHVWQASLGGRLRSRTICCDACNHAISIPEKALFDALVHSFATVGAVNDSAEPLSVAVVFEGNTFQLADGNAILETPGVRFDAETKSLIIPLPAGFAAQVELFAKLLLRHSKTPDDTDKLYLVPGDPGPALPVGPQPNEHDLSVGGLIPHKQVFVKMALELLAYHRHDLVMRGELSEARRFARWGTGTFSAKPDGCGSFATDEDGSSFDHIERRPWLRRAHSGRSTRPAIRSHSSTRNARMGRCARAEPHTFDEMELPSSRVRGVTESIEVQGITRLFAVAKDPHPMRFARCRRCCSTSLIDRAPASRVHRTCLGSESRRELGGSCCRRR